MANCGNFLDYAGEKCGIDVGYGKLILVYPAKAEVAISALTATAINAAIEAGTIIGVIKGWHTVVGAPVAEVGVERVATSEMKLIREEIAADTLTFERTLANREIIGDLVKAGSLNCLMVDDQGNVYGDHAQAVGEIQTMLLNFSSKVTSGMQSDNNTDRTIAVTVRYLVKDLDVAAAEVAAEDIVVKELVKCYLSSVTTSTAIASVFVLAMRKKSDNKIYPGAITASEIAITGGNITTKESAYDAATGLLTITLAGTGFSTTAQKWNVSISGEECYMKETVLSLGE